MRLTISNSEIQTWKTCHRKWWLTYYRELGLKRENQRLVGARELGTRIHIALDAMYADGLNPVETVNELYADDAIDLAEGSDELINLRKEQDLAKAMLEGYMIWLAETGADEGIEVVATETVVEVHSGIPGVYLRGKLDQRILRKVDGARLFLDHKTVANLTDPPRHLPLDEQMKFYTLLERLDALYKTGDEPPWITDGGLYNMLRKVKRTVAAKPPFYDRVEIRHNKAVMQSMWARVHKVIEEILVVRKALDDGADHQYVAYPRPSRDCSWSCDFFAVCPMFDDGSNVEGLLEEYYGHVDPYERYLAIEAGKAVTQ
jgi:RecB family exonuclease